MKMLITVAIFWVFPFIGHPSPTPTPKTTDGMYLYHQDFGQWLDVVWSGATTEERWHPNWTSIVTNYKPVVHKLPHGRYEITFTSDIMKDLP